MERFRMLIALLLSAPICDPRRPPHDRRGAAIKIVTSLTTYGAIAREIVGDKGTVTSIAQGDEDPHFVQPKPSFVAVLRDADLFVTTGLDLELWVPPLLDRAGNRKVSEGGPGYVTAYTGIQLLEVPTSLSRSEGDIHQDGNPHIHTDPRERHHHRPEHSDRAPARLARELGLLRRSRAGLRAAGARGHHRRRPGGVLTAPVAYDLLKSDKLLRLPRPEAVSGQAAARPARRLDEGGAGVPREGDRLLPQGVGLLQQPVQGDLRRVHRGEAGHPADAGPRPGGDRPDEAAEDPRALRLELFRPEPDPAGGAAHRRPGGHRPREHQRRARRQHLLRPHERMGQRPRRGLQGRDAT